MVNSIPTVSLDGNVLILTLPAFASSNHEENQRYADILNQALSNNDYKGVIVNLEDNTGGDMGPMISGLSTLIPDGKIVTFEYRNGQTQELILENSSLIGGGTTVTVGNTKKIADVPVAVIINKSTGSSGEIVALALKGLDNVQIFGEASAGYTSGNSQISLYDGTIMQLTTSAIIDRTGERYENVAIIPDVETNEPFLAAREWIQSK